MEKRSCYNCRHGSKANVRGKFNCPKGCRGLGHDNPLWATHWAPIEPKDCEKCEEMNCNECIK